jgi:hypothetical protein
VLGNADVDHGGDYIIALATGPADGEGLMLYWVSTTVWMEAQMNIALWVIQVILGIKLVSTAVTHAFGGSNADMQAARSKIGRPARFLHPAVALVSLLGVLGLLLPGLIGWPAWLTPGTAGLLSVVFLASIVFHTISREKPKVFVSLVLFVFAAFIVYGRGFLLPFGS